MIRRLVRHALVAALLAGGCGATDRAAGKIPVAVSIAPHAWLVEQIGGGRVTVFELVRPGESPETYQPADQQVTRLLRATVYFRAGLPFESSPWFDAIEKTGLLAIVDLRRGLTAGDDAHTWLAPRNLELQGRTITESLVDLDRAHASDYRRRLADLEARLDALDRDLRQALLPLAGRPFFVFHPAWGHFADAYNLRQIAIEVEGKEPTDRELTEIQRLARQAGARVVFVQPQVSSRAASAVARAVGGRIATLDPLARDVELNLRSVAAALLASFSESSALSAQQEKLSRIPSR